MNIKSYVKFINSDETQSWISEFLSNHPRDNNLTEDEISRLSEIVTAANAVYNYSGIETKISDDLYNTLFEKLELAQDGASVDTTAPVIGDGEVGYHKYKSLRGTLDKIYYLSEEDAKDAANKSRRGLPEWISSAEKKLSETLGHPVSLADEEIYVFPKWDGVSCIFEFNADGSLDRALTRGFTETNEAQIVTHIFKDWLIGPWTNYPTPYGLKTEIMISENDLLTYNNKYGTNYKNSRSIVSSIMNSDEVDSRVNCLQIMQLRASVLDEDGNESLQTLVPGAFEKPYIKCRFKDVDMIKEFAYNHKYVNGLRCDGAVIYLINETYQKILGRKDNKQKYEVAFKFTEETGYSKVTGCNFTVGLFGRITPVLEIKPIKLKGNTITNISLGSIERFNSMNLSIGDTVKVLYDIIPYALFDESDSKCKRSKKGKKLEEPKICPECGAPLERKNQKNSIESESILYCNNEDCPCRVKGKILNYLRKMYIDLLSYATVDRLYAEGYLRSIFDIYKLKKHRKSLVKMEGFGETSIDSILEEIDSSKYRTTPDYIMLGAIGIESIGPKVFKQILSEITFDELMDLCINDDKDKAINTLVAIPGIKDKKALKVYEGIRENQKLIEYLESQLIISSEEPGKTKFSVCFTKVRDTDLENFIKAHGGVVEDSLTKKVDMLIVPVKGIKSSKVAKAEKYGIDIVPIDDAEAYIYEHFK